MGEARTPRVSVIVPVFGVEELVEECLRSILAQTHTNLQVVVVDDGSRDGSATIARQIGAEDPRVEVHAYPNGGLGLARNRGLAHAEGDYVAFVDGDDVLPPRALATMVASLERTGSDFATGNVERLVGTERRRSPQHAPALGLPDPATSLRRRPDLVWATTSCNSLFRRSFWDRAELSFAVGVLYEDMATMARAYACASSIDVVGAVTYLWRLREDGSSITQQRARPENLEDRLRALAASRARYATAGDDVLRAFDEKVATMDVLLYAPVAQEGGVRLQRALRSASRQATRRVDRSRLPVRARVLHTLIRRRNWSALVPAIDFFREHGQDLPVSSVRGDTVVVEIPRVLDGAKIGRFGRRLRTLGGPLTVPEVAVTSVRWVDDTLEIAGRTRFRSVPAAHLDVTVVLGGASHRAGAAVTVERPDGPGPAEFVARWSRAELAKLEPFTGAMVVTLTNDGVSGEAQVVPRRVPGSVAGPSVSADRTVVRPVVERGAPLRVEVQRRPHVVTAAHTTPSGAGAHVEVDLVSASSFVLRGATFTLPTGASVQAGVTQLQDGTWRVTATLAEDKTPGQRYWRLRVDGGNGRPAQVAVTDEAVLVSQTPRFRPVATGKGWFTVLEDESIATQAEGRSESA